MEKINITASDNLILKGFYSKAEKPIGAIVIVHGMVEHKERYIPLIEKLNEAGYNVTICDLRGHGESINEEYSLGRIASIDQMVDDTNRVVEYAKKHNPNFPIFMYAHSMGTLIARMYIRKHALSINKLLISGTVAYQPGCWIAVFLAKLKSMGKGKYKYSKLLFSFSNDGSSKEDLSWLSYNKENIERYQNDPLCSFKFTNYSNYVLFSMTYKLHKHSKKYEYNPNLVIMSLSGSDDRTTKKTKGVRDSVKHLIFDGYSNISYKEYPNMKHEILMEDNKDDVIKDMIEFFGK